MFDIVQEIKHIQKKTKSSLDNNNKNNQAGLKETLISLLEQKNRIIEIKILSMYKKNQIR